MDLKSFLTFIGVMAVSGFAIGLVAFLLVGILGSRMKVVDEPIKLSPSVPTRSKSKKNSTGGSKIKKKKRRKKKA